MRLLSGALARARSRLRALPRVVGGALLSPSSDPEAGALPDTPNDRALSDAATAALHEFEQLVDVGDSDAFIRTSAERWLEVVEPAVTVASQIASPPAIDADLICRCVLRRAFDGAKAILHLTDNDLSYNAMALLRPMCEDFFFVSYLLQLPRPAADAYIVEKARLEITQGLRAQEEFFPRMRQRFEQPGLPIDEKKVAHLSARIEQHQVRLKAMGKQLGWGSRDAPSVKHMAHEVDALPEYEFFYHGASSAVHASLHHLLRMVWGDPRRGPFTVSNERLLPQYKLFTIIYGVWLASQIFGLVESQLGLSKSYDEDASSIWLAALIVPSLRHNAPPIVTREELRWNGPPLKGA